MKVLLAWVRHRLGAALLDLAMRVLPSSTSESIGIRRGLADQREYDRYSGYCAILHQAPMPFGTWIRERAWVSRARAAGAV